jgi:hypothetical protein
MLLLENNLILCYKYFFSQNTIKPVSINLFYYNIFYSTVFWSINLIIIITEIHWDNILQHYVNYKQSSGTFCLENVYILELG